MKKSFVRFLVFVCLCVGGTLAAHADPVLYTLSGNFTGTLDGVKFTGVAGSFTELSDTSLVTTIDPGLYYTNTGGSAVLNLGGFAPIYFPGTALGVESETSTASFYDLRSGFAVGAYADAINTDLFTPYDLTTFIGPVQGFFVGTGAFERTSLGDLTISGATGDLTFTASSVSPEPSSLLMFGTGLLGIAAAARRRLVRA